MLPRIVQAYFEEGYAFEMGSPARLATGVIPVDEWRPMWRNEPSDYRHIGISLRDAWYIQLAAQSIGPTPSLVIGNSHGISTLLIAELLKPEPMDAIDAQVSRGSDLGSDLTRRIAKRLGLSLSLTAGFSPQDLDQACSRNDYGFVLIDGEHTDKQLLLDFEGIVHRLADQCIVYCHDVGLRDMDDGWLKVREIAEPMGLRGFDLSATDFGSTMLVRGLPELERTLELTCPGLRSHACAYHGGIDVNMPTHNAETDRVVLNPGQRVAFYGAGNDLKHQGHFILSHPEAVTGIFDDNPAIIGTQRFGVKVTSAEELPSLHPEVIVISTHAHQEQVRHRIANLSQNALVYPRPGILAPARVFMQVH